VTYDQIGNDPVQLTSKESVEFRLSHTKREPKLRALNLFSISPACFAMEQTPFNDYDIRSPRSDVVNSGGSDGTRTRGLLRDRQAFQPAELRPRKLVIDDSFALRLPSATCTPYKASVTGQRCAGKSKWPINRLSGHMIATLLASCQV
jgi:hypothetical protein